MRKDDFSEADLPLFTRPKASEHERNVMLSAGKSSPFAAPKGCFGEHTAVLLPSIRSQMTDLQRVAVIQKYGIISSECRFCQKQRHFSRVICKNL
ncbi:hypothetical protein [Segatella baroniae]|uniref:hypothetical protein n=1 Tax=Segatella baroniae TaxID=305719 RepID=UPI0012B5EA84|nr:hypothetical protein [Segatella baroniae]